MVAQLGRRGGGRSESGAFLLGDRDGDPARVRQIVYLDDLDPNCLQGSIRFDGRAYSQLWEICEQQGRKVLADVHTHPHDWVDQSPTDMENPMVALRGHLAMILPDLAMHAVKLASVGLHEYRGEDGWVAWTGTQAAGRIKLRWVPW
jgi:proteasome lid subunit RPN8/RPN11